jgi:hypothetical protein
LASVGNMDSAPNAQAPITWRRETAGGDAAMLGDRVHWKATAESPNTPNMTPTATHARIPDGVFSGSSWVTATLQRGCRAQEATQRVHVHDWQAPKRLRSQPRRPQPVLLIAVPQLALVASAAGPDRPFHCQSRSVKCACSDHDDERIAMQRVQGRASASNRESSARSAGGDHLSAPAHQDMQGVPSANHKGRARR